jgi:hypothetical protein
MRHLGRHELKLRFGQILEWLAVSGNRANGAPVKGLGSLGEDLSPLRGLFFLQQLPHGLRRGLHSFATSRLARIIGADAVRHKSLRTYSRHFDLFVYQAFVVFGYAGEFEGVRGCGFALLYGGDHVGAADPVGFLMVRL